MPHLRCNPVHVSSFANTSSVAIQLEAIENAKHFSMISKIVFKSTFYMTKYYNFTKNLIFFKLKVLQLCKWSASLPGVEITMCGFTDKSMPCFIISGKQYYCC
jgi:hypothetical protein